MKRTGDGECVRARTRDCTRSRERERERERERGGRESEIDTRDGKNIWGMAEK